MSYFFSDVFRTALLASDAFVTNAHVGMALFYGAPAFSGNDPRYTGIDTVAELAGTIGWSEIEVEGYPLSNEVIMGTRISGGSTYAMMSLFLIDDDMLPAQVRAVAFYYKGSLGGVTNPLILVTSDPVAPSLVLKGGDAIAPRPDSTLSGQETQWLFGWDTDTRVSLVQTPGLSSMKNAPEFEPSYVQHVWLFPQRTNLVANPNFEGGINHWRTNGTAAAVTEGTNKVGSFTGTAPVVVESNKFPAMSSQWTLRVFASGDGPLRIGLVTWPVEYNETNVDWGYEEEWELSAGGYIDIQCLREAPQPYEGQLRLECDGTTLKLDKVLVEPECLLGWPYFDGDTTYGARDDFSWYGGENLKGKTYSMWYNNKRATAGRLFSTVIGNKAIQTDVEELASGLVYGWVPAGTTVEPHWDVLFVNDLQHPVPDLAGTPVTPYKTLSITDPGYFSEMGIANPWPTPMWEGSAASLGVAGQSGAFA